MKFVGYAISGASLGIALFIVAPADLDFWKAAVAVAIGATGISFGEALAERG